MTDENKEVKSEVELGLCTRHAAFPISQGVKEVDIQTPFGKRKEKVNVVTQEFAKCVGELCETSWCEEHESCKDICEHRHAVHNDDEIDRVFIAFEKALIDVGIETETIKKVIEGVQKELEENENIEDNIGVGT